MKLSIIPKKSLGQNFLVNPKILDKIVAAAEITKVDLVLEVGPGTGNLTEKLAAKAGKVIAIEKDRRLIETLKLKFKDSNVEIIEADVLKLKIEELIENCKLKIENYKIVGNIPYYITSKFLRTVFEDWPKPKLIVLTIQKEVAQRIMASPPHSKMSVGARPPKMNLLALSVQFFAEPKIIGYISKENFRPRPKVDSALLRLLLRVRLRTNTVKLRRAQQSKEFTEKFFKIAKAGFSHKRKLLSANLSKNFGIIKEELIEIFRKIGIQPDSRAENLSLNQWIELTKYIRK
ncbi:MAG: 16S rRNA (adenine1518-N6/adenine1519-N6)-dimethyltransferase [Parcubacteria group bacterium Gr01-1014_2]|nr:MAG: 16S rRNA (adenine1518-N6/adenine1519-N6)-dimethyltransferase [Parcubacteria group bacterium Gr01-1014_2]